MSKNKETTLSQWPVTEIKNEKYKEIKKYILDKLGITARDWENYTSTIAKIESESTPPTHHKVKDTVGGNVHKVETNDTVSGIAEKYNITQDKLLELNPDIDDKKFTIYKGQTLKLPEVDIEGQEIELPSSNTEIIGDFLSEIAEDYNTTVDELKELNQGIENKDKLEAGDEIILPGLKKKEAGIGVSYDNWGGDNDHFDGRYQM